MKIIRNMILMLLFISVLYVASCSDNTESNGVPLPDRPTGVPAPGKLAPDFQLESLDGQSVSLSSLQGKPLVLNFWATWCGPCRMEMPFVQGVYVDSKWSDLEVVILAVNVGESSSTAQSFMEANKLTFTVLLDTTNEVAMAYNISAIPTTYFVDRNGIIKNIKIGAFRNKAEIDRILTELIQVDQS